jgi:hypothetical protein
VVGVQVRWEPWPRACCFCSVADETSRSFSMMMVRSMNSGSAEAAESLISFAFF